MLTLPPELAPWEPYLQFLEPSLMAPMASLTGLLARHLGRPSRDRELDGEPSGWSGITARGRLERLVESQWALADEVPDEFLRRSVEGELMYWNPARQEGTQGGCIKLLFDAGPSQLGACRIVQLALLVVFFRRAVEEGVDLVWGVAQGGAPECDIFPRALSDFLRARSSRSLCAEDVERFQARTPPGEVLVVGPSGILLEQVAPLVVSVTAPGKAPFRLELPPVEVAQRFLRNPFGTQRFENTVQSREVGHDIRFCHVGRRLLARTATGVNVYPIPNSPRDTVGKVRNFDLRFSTELVAMGYFRKALQIVQVGPTPGTWVGYRVNPQGESELFHWEAPEDAGVDRASSGFLWFDPSHGLRIRRGIYLWTAPFRDGEYGPLQLDATVDDFLSTTTPLMRIGRDLIRLQHQPFKLFELPENVDLSEVILGSDPFSPGALAYRSGPVWRVRWKGQEQVLTEPDGQVIGVLPERDHMEYATLVVLRAALGEIGFHSNHTQSEIKFDSPLVETVVCASNSLVGYRTERGEVGVYSHAFGQFLVRVSP